LIVSAKALSYDAAVRGDKAGLGKALGIGHGKILGGFNRSSQRFKMEAGDAYQEGAFRIGAHDHNSDVSGVHRPRRSMA